MQSGNTKSCGCYKKDIVSEKNIKNKKINKYDLSGEYGIGYTNKNQQFFFDKEDYDVIKTFSWYITSEGYVATDINKRTIMQHRMIMNAPDELQIDHIYHILHDNRKSQLRICTEQNNCMNRSLRSDNTSGKTGVRWHKGEEKYEARIYISGKYIFLGYYDEFNDAVNARLSAEEKYFGEYQYKKEV